MKIESLTHHAMGRTSDGTLVPRVLPGEEVDLLDDGQVRIVTPSVDRVSPPCPHFKSCGGCAMQHASDSFVARWKQTMVQRALSAQGLLDDISGIATSPPSSRRRAKLTGRRTKKGAMIGFHARASDHVVPVPGCTLLSPALMAGFPAAEELTKAVCSRTNEASIMLTESLVGLDVSLHGARNLDEALRIELARIAQAHGLARLTYGGEPVVTIAPPEQAFGASRVVPPPGSFLQATAHGEATLCEAVEQHLKGAKKVVDLFSGCGTFSLPLAARSSVHAVEGESAMLQALDDGWRKAQGLRQVTTEKRDLFRRPLLPDELADFDAAVIDPPRAGAEAQVAELARSTIPVIAMVSCNPVTFARDARSLVDSGFAMLPPLVVDQFRWSTHVEVVTRFSRM